MSEALGDLVGISGSDDGDKLGINLNLTQMCRHLFINQLALEVNILTRDPIMRCAAAAAFRVRRGTGQPHQSIRFLILQVDESGQQILVAAAR